MTKWQAHDEMSLDKEKVKRKMLYYASPIPHSYGYFVSTIKSVREEYLKARNND